VAEPHRQPARATPQGFGPAADAVDMRDAEFTLYICDGCGSHAWLPEEIVHFNQQCRGKSNDEAIAEVVLVPRDRELVAA
jgi:hypothetical protein